MYRLGTTSYIIPDHILPNVRYLAGKVQDIELVLFEVDADGSANSPSFNNLPSAADIAELRRLAALYGLSYTVHLPLDLKLADDGSDRDLSLQKARKVIACTRPLTPWAYIVHLDGRHVRHSRDPGVLQHWQEQAVEALEIVARWAGGMEKLAVENLDHYPPGFNDPVIERTGAGRCIDIGHLWVDGHAIMDYLPRWLPQTRVIHLHGVDLAATQRRDHLSLARLPGEALASTISWLRANYRGVLTLEVFGEADFLSSLEALWQVQAQTSRLTLLLGGARSGKSTHAQDLAHSLGNDVLYVATATAGDEEMAQRIANHRAERPAHWRTLEAPANTGAAIQAVDPPPEVILLDCLTLLVSNVLLALPEDAGETEAAQAVDQALDALLAAFRASKARWIVVSNEVGMGLVPPYPLGRLYRDVLGRANQRLARSAGEVLLLVAGLPVNLKP
ncbi:MAG: cobamide remodeling phosphodiesterase CbiR [Chloroflexota bacterium]